MAGWNDYLRAIEGLSMFVAGIAAAENLPVVGGVAVAVYVLVRFLDGGWQ